MKLFISSTLLLLELSAMKTKIFPLTHNDFFSQNMLSRKGFASLREKRRNHLCSRLNVLFVWTKN